MASGGANGSPPTIARFGAFELDVRTGELRRHGAKVRLGRQPIQILQILLERPGEIAHGNSGPARSSCGVARRAARWPAFHFARAPIATGRCCRSRTAPSELASASR